MDRIASVVKRNKLFCISELIILSVVVVLSLLCTRFGSINFWIVFGSLLTTQTLINWGWTWNRKWSQFYY